MQYYSLPINLNKIDLLSKENSVIDMSLLNFKCDIGKQKRSSFLFIRNTNIDIPITFQNCSYEDKEEFLLMYMFGDINVNLDILVSTWLKILLSKVDNRPYLLSIFDDDEIERFCENNKEIINEIYQFIISIPLCSINFYLGYNKIETDISINEFETTDYDKINIKNFIKLIYHDEFLLLITHMENIKPLYYIKYFNMDNNILLKELLKKLPFLNILNILINPNFEEVHTKFINKLSDLSNN